MPCCRATGASPFAGGGSPLAKLPKCGPLAVGKALNFYFPLGGIYLGAVVKAGWGEGGFQNLDAVSNREVASPRKY